jgi:nucleoside-diphosphate-sugar epimerase
MKLLITGVHGFVGSNLVNALSDKFEIYGLDIVAPQKSGVKKTYSWQDLNDGKVPQVDAIIHLAGKAHDTKNSAAYEIYFEINTNLTKRIYDYFLASEASKFIFFSSVKAVADFVPGEILTEDVEPKPIGPYGESKIKAEEYIKSKSCPGNKRVYILRPCMIYKLVNSGNLYLLYRILKKGIPWPLGKFDNKRSYTSIENLTFIINAILTKSVKSGIYNIADDEVISTNKMVEIICKSLNKDAHILYINKSIVKFAAKIGGFLHLPFNSDTMKKLTNNYIVSNAKIKRELGIGSMPCSTEQGLLKILSKSK